MNLLSLERIVVNAAQDTMVMVVRVQLVETKGQHLLVELQQPMIVRNFM